MRVSTMGKPAASASSNWHLIGIIGSKREATEILEQVKKFLRESLHLEVSESKTGIRYAKEGTRFLGYDVRVHTGDRIVRTLLQGRHTTKRSFVEKINIYVPEEKVKAFCQAKKPSQNFKYQQ